MIEENFIEHFGTKGMKWGIRKKSSGGKKGKKGKTKVSDLSDEVLAKKVKRMNMEKQYKDLKKNKRDQSIVRKGAKVAGQIVGKSAKQSVTTVTTKEFTRALEAHIAKKAGRTVATVTAGAVGG
jgi:hypothetical protein